MPALILKENYFRNNMTHPSKSIRFTEFISILKIERAANSREDAVSLLQEVMNRVEDSHGLRQNEYDLRMNVFPLDEAMGWKNIHVDPCYWDDAATSKYRTEVFHNGRIVISRLGKQKVVVIDKLGANAKGI